jgi:hypothetical protein
LGVELVPVDGRVVAVTFDVVYATVHVAQSAGEVHLADDHDKA